jgi:hypothetical protein
LIDIFSLFTKLALYHRTGQFTTMLPLKNNISTALTIGEDLGYSFIQGEARMATTFSLFFRNFLRRETTIRAIKVAVIVAPILVVINHYDEILSLKFTSTFFFKATLTFFVPYCISAYSSARAYSEKGN